MPKEVEVGDKKEVKLDAFAEPQTRFRANGSKMGKHIALVDNPAFDIGSDTALLQYVIDLSAEATDLNSAARVGFQIRGAIEGSQRFKTLAELPKERPRLPNLDALKPTEPYRRP